MMLPEEPKTASPAKTNSSRRTNSHVSDKEQHESRIEATKLFLDRERELLANKELAKKQRPCRRASLGAIRISGDDCCRAESESELEMPIEAPIRRSRRASLSGANPRLEYGDTHVAIIRIKGGLRASVKGSPKGKKSTMRCMSNEYNQKQHQQRRGSTRGHISAAALRMSEHDDEDDLTPQEDSDNSGMIDYDYGYEATNHAHTYGYGYGVTPGGRGSAYHQTRRCDSNRSLASSASSRSRRRNSCLIRKDADPRALAELMAGPPRVTDSDLELEDSDYSASGHDYDSNNPYDSGLESNHSAQESDYSGYSARRVLRRNSCIIRPDNQDLMASSSFLEMAAPRMSDRDMLHESGAGSDGLLYSHCPAMNEAQDDDEYDDFNDPDSLLKRSGYINANQESLQQQQVASNAVQVPGSPSKNSQSKAYEARSSPAKRSSWARLTPFMSPHSPETILTKEMLQAAEKNLARVPHHHLPHGDAEQHHHDIIPESPFHSTGNWGDLALECISSSSDDSDEESFGASMYKDDYSQTYEEIDRYKQRARRRVSLERSCINMDELLLAGKSKNKSKMGKKSKVPNFTPAVGCTNASDFIVRCFCARLRLGVTVIKHNRSRWSKSQKRILYLLPDGRTLSWKPIEGELDKGKRPRLDLSKCKEVRHAWSRDPETRKQLGTSILRKRCSKDGSANKSLALIFSKRTLDMTAISMDQCKVLMEGFSALCFRLQMVRLEEEKSSRDYTSCDVSSDYDWASTVFGGCSTVSMTQSAFTGASPSTTAPWGL